ncbi:50S ribosomal protein L9 [Allofrancisella guangzhouensis]|uniref:Large ribosomal subunit protein bL9 n=1 Tax=Allofrancisella guangzhouensis TaxID=594679 RepID=A0A0A8E4M5_9GAMM|nr:50S ribosomal protein L9 [Allofrancisella guangzhouensis]AJC49175.1 50S ribosomal protein L9 [Allofrancisella guangzhouensis]MBK2026766.1 50S ribosomal protein L9 [Allofrancisella guangzhouensis]MBK2044438.1 50S ribosomal protein L9 [Allofrancisella guangzhouensis]MBK2045354.1 50S ribosomal protein L9 [Allofrancisella guangzhouensis]
MQVILKEKVENLGVLGDVVNVKPGYARNFLIPFGKAVQATKVNIETFEAQKVELQKAEKARFDAAVATAEAIKGKEFTIAAQAGEGGKLFGSVGTAEVAKAVSEATGKEVEKSQVRMPEGVIRSIGEFDLTIHIYTDVDVDIKVNVVASES